MATKLFVTLVSFVTLASGLIADVNHPTGTRGLLLIDKLGGTIRFFDPVTFKERSSIKVATNPHDFALSADRKRRMCRSTAMASTAAIPTRATKCLSSTRMR
jgi:hypothetical protein